MLPQITRISTDLYNPHYVTIEFPEPDDEPVARHTKSSFTLRTLDG
jgi:hypothetical protein